MKPACGNPKCGGSTNIAEDASFGHGELDECGFWEFPCPVCARDYEREHPNENAWPYRLPNGESSKRFSRERILDKTKMLILLEEFNQRCAHTKECNVYANPINGQCICGLNDLRARLAEFQLRKDAAK